MPDITITPANVKPSANANPIRGTSTGAINAGDVVAVYADGSIGPADSNGGSPIDTPVGIAACSADGAGQFIMYVGLDSDFTIGGTTASGIPYFLSGNPGKICEAADLAAGMKTSLIGFGKAGNHLVVSVLPSGQTV
jgi:hypothetical protein